MSRAGASRLVPPFSPLAEHFGIDTTRVFLNHGSFGAVPGRVREAQAVVRARMDADPVRFIVEELEPAMDRARAAMSTFVGCPAGDFAFVENATAGVNTILRSLRFQPGDELLTSAQEYNACNNVLAMVADQWGARVVHAPVPFPVKTDDEVVDAMLGAVTERTRLALVSHITSPTGIILPVKRIVAALAARGIDTLVDGAHSAGFVPLNVADIGAAYYTGNFHKWLCAPHGSAFLHVRKDRQGPIHPLILSHGYNSPRTDRSKFRLEFDYVGSLDPSPWLCTPDAAAVVGGLAPAGGGWPEIMRANRALALKARDLLCRELGVEPPAPDHMIGAMAAVPVPDRRADERGVWGVYPDPLQERLIERWGVQVPVNPFPAPPRRWVRISAHLYNTIEQYEHLARALKAECAGRA